MTVTWGKTDHRNTNDAFRMEQSKEIDPIKTIKS